jgi:hypothetical protein
MLDTESGSDYLIPLFKNNNVPFHTDKTRSFSELVDAVSVAEKEASVLIIDSITHFWSEIQDAYLKKTGRKRLTLADWGQIKSTWRIFTDAFLNSKCHIIVCGRARDVTDFQEEEDGTKQFVKVGTMMATEKNLAYEPSLLVEMVKEMRPTKQKEGQMWNHTAYVLKDRSTLLEGKSFINPTFKEFEPFFNFLNIGGEHLSVDTTHDSSAMFEDGNDRNYAWKKKQCEIMVEEIEGLLTSSYPGQSAAEKKIKVDLIEECFGTRSWKKVEEMMMDDLKIGTERLVKAIKARKETPDAAH